MTAISVVVSILQVLYKFTHLHSMHDILCRACGNLVIMTFKYMWLVLKPDIRVSDYVIILKPPKLC